MAAPRIGAPRAARGATGGQDILSSRATNARRVTKTPIERAVRGVGATWVRAIDRTYDLAKVRDTLREAMTTPEKGPKIIIAQSEFRHPRLQEICETLPATLGQRILASAGLSRRGYGDTFERGLGNFRRIMDMHAVMPQSAENIRRLRALALSDESGKALDEGLRAA